MPRTKTTSSSGAAASSSRRKPTTPQRSKRLLFLCWSRACNVCGVSVPMQLRFSPSLNPTTNSHMPWFTFTCAGSSGRSRSDLTQPPSFPARHSCAARNQKVPAQHRAPDPEAAVRAAGAGDRERAHAGALPVDGGGAVGAAGGGRGRDGGAFRGLQPVRHPRQAGDDHAEGHAARPAHPGAHRRDRLVLIFAYYSHRSGGGPLSGRERGASGHPHMYEQEPTFTLSLA